MLAPSEAGLEAVSVGSDGVGSALELELSVVEEEVVEDEVVLPPPLEGLELETPALLRSPCSCISFMQVFPMQSWFVT